MSSSEDSAYAEMAVRMGLLSSEDSSASQAALRARIEAGDKLRLSDVLQERGHLTKRQVRDVYRGLHQLGMYPRIGNYEILAKLGQGAMGRVYQARQVDTGRLVALKVLPRRLSRNGHYLKRFAREAEATAKLNHENVVQAVDVGEADGYHYFAMEYIEGRTVKDLMKKHGPLDEEQALPIVIQVAKALEHANGLGIIHRDVKPSNIMITRNGLVKLCDLGLAKETSSEEDLQLTTSGMAVGTAYYISPEQARGLADLDIRSDIYSLGATLYHMLVGEVPFEGSSPAVVMTKHVTESLPAPKEQNLALSDHVCNIMEKMMAKDRDRRYQTPRELIDDLELAMEGRPPAASLALYMATDSTAEAQAVSEPIGAEGLPAPRAAAPTLIGYTIVALGLLAAAALLAMSRSFTATGAQQAAAQTRLDQAKRLYLVADKFATENPQNFLGVLSRFELVAQAAADTEYSRQARQKMAAVQRRLDEAAEPVFIRLKAEADEIAEARQFAKALALWDRFPGVYAVREWHAKIEAERDRYRRLAEAQYGKLAARAKALLEDGNFTAAVETYRTAEAFGIADITAQASAAVRQTEAKRNEVRAGHLFGKAVDAFQRKQYHAAKRLVAQVDSLSPQFGLTSGDPRAPRQGISLPELKAALADKGALLVVRQDGTSDYATIRDALLAARPGDIVEIRDGGLYREPSLGYCTASGRFDSAIVSKGHITLRGLGPRPTIVNSAASPDDYLLRCGPNWRVENIEFVFGNGLYVYDGPATVRGCRFRSPNGTCIGLGGKFGVVEVENCAFKDARSVLDIGKVTLPSCEVMFRHNVSADVKHGFMRSDPSTGVVVSATNSIWVNVRVSLILDTFGYTTAKWQTEGNCYWKVAAFYEGGTPQSQLRVLDLTKWRAKNTSDRLSIAADPCFDPTAKVECSLSPASPCRKAGVGEADMGLRFPAEGEAGAGAASAAVNTGAQPR